MIPDCDDGGLPPLVGGDSTGALPLPRSPYRAAMPSVMGRFSTHKECGPILLSHIGLRTALRAAGLTEGLQWIDGSLMEDCATVKGRARGLGTRGSSPAAIRQQSRLDITVLGHGSFGFMLEENDEGQPLFESPTRAAVHTVTDLLQGVAAAYDGRFDGRLKELDFQLFASLKSFIFTLHKGGSTLKFSERERDLRLTPAEVTRAYESVSHANVDEVEETVEGERLGIVSIARTSELKTADGDVVTLQKRAPTRPMTGDCGLKRSKASIRRQRDAGHSRSSAWCSPVAIPVKPFA